MSFATEIAKDRSHRYTLVRLTPARYVGGDLASEGGGIYGMSFPYPIARIERNGTALTEDTAAPSVNDHWYHNEATGDLDVKLASAPDPDTNVIVVFYYLFYSSHPVSLYETPDDDTTPMRPWEPRLASDPTFNQGISDVFYGVFTVQSSSFDFENADSAFQSYLTADDSFNNKAVDVWLVVNDQVAKAFNGIVKSLSVDTRVSVQVLDEFEKLSQPAFMGDTSYEAICQLHASSFPDMDPAQDGTPCPYVIGKNRHAWNVQPERVGVSRYLRYLNADITTSPINTDVSNDIDGDKNRTWTLCRLPPAGHKTLDFGTITNATASSAGATFKYFPGGAHIGGSVQHSALRLTHTGHNLEIGDSFSWSHASISSGATQHAVVMEFDGTYTWCMVPRGITSTTDVTAGTFNSNSAPAICVYDPSAAFTYPLYYGLDFTLSVTTTSGGNKQITIVFEDDFETADADDGSSYDRHPLLTTLDPTTHKIMFRVTQDDGGSARHGDVVERILTTAGIPVDSTSITDANADFDVDVCMMIPRFDEQVYGIYRDYLQEILRSTLGIVKVNATDGEAEYFLAAAPNASDEIDDNLILGDPPSITVDYRDIATEIIASNPHLPAGYATSDAAATVSSAKAKYLHGVDQKLQMTHVLTDISGRIDTILAVYAARRAVYRFKVATSLLQSAIGDDVTLTTSTLLGGEASRDMKITSLSKSASDVEVEVTDLEGL